MCRRCSPFTRSTRVCVTLLHPDTGKRRRVSENCPPLRHDLHDCRGQDREGATGPQHHSDSVLLTRARISQSQCTV
ncbi:hypothetical protein AMELA_G00025360 [Ameiurus melas]|uniref:Uncharacterized protein n=1 Tax=Ameiurus melas TaxID=219545 RepID=A0A7J6BDZ2_AMEME|nr:hypothetical protein AMELA_G00025360 [Ameiurus melas]